MTYRLILLGGNMN